jgi:hypothetical protein
MEPERLVVNGEVLENLYIGSDFELPLNTLDIQFVSQARRIITQKSYATSDPIVPLVYNNQVDKYHIDEVIDEVTRFLQSDDPAKIQFSEKEWYWEGYIKVPNQFTYNETLDFFVFNIELKLTEKYRLSNTQYTNTAISDVVDVVNEGTADTDMIVEATALENSTMFMIAKGDDDYFMLGKPTDAFKGEADTTPTVWIAKDSTFLTFTKRPENTYVGDSNLTGQYATGSISLSGNVLQASYGTTSMNDVWHGPVYRKSLDNLVDDFHTRSSFRINQISGHGVGKSFIHLYDDAGNRVLSYGLIDPTNRGRNVKVVVRLYTSSGGYEEIYSSQGYRYDNVYADRSIWVSVDRVGSRYIVKTWHNYTENGIKKVTARAQVSYNDGEGLFARPIAIGEIAMARHSKYPAADQAMSWSRIEDDLDLEDVVPYLIKAGDEVLIDTKQSLVLLNDEPMTSEKDFGSNYFKIDKGLNRLLIEPQGKFDTTVKWHDRYL